MLFDTFHVLYMIISFALTIGLLVLFKKFVKNENTKSLLLKIIACTVVLIHYSELWVNYLSNGYTTVESPMLFPIYPCNVMMWLLLAIAFIKNKNTLFFKILTEFVAIAGTVCGVLGIVLNVNYDSVGLNSYAIFSGLFSHSVMVLGTLYLFDYAKVKIHVFNTISIICGLLFFVVDGVVINTIFALAGLESPNSMYLIGVPFENLPWLTPLTIGIVAISLVFFGTMLVELLTRKPEDRWYTKVKALFKSNKHLAKKEMEETSPTEEEIG